ncbi:MAG: hypothetical protein IPJ74_21380 [Saprospiraceae bacterium]|nr:hypothetical protein [Saprospiraceae bacterium]
MKHKYYLSIFVAIAFCGSLFSQSDASSDYGQLMNGQNEQTQEFIKWSDALRTVGGNYIATIEKIFDTEGITVQGSNDQDTEIRKNQLEWMINVAPFYVSATDKKKKSDEKIEAIVTQFGDEFALSIESINIITQNLKLYSDTYSKYQTAYSNLIKGLHKVKSLTPTFLPPPPPPAQQHHRGN